MKRIVYSVVIVIIFINSINWILSFQARERYMSSIEGAPPIERIDGIRITTFSFSSDNSMLSFRLKEEQIESLQNELNCVKFKKSNFSTREQTIHDAFFSFYLDIMANKTAYKMTVYNNSEVVINDEDTYFLTNTDLVRLLFEYTIEQIGYSKKE
jgi:hypothetical protein